MKKKYIPRFTLIIQALALPMAEETVLQKQRDRPPFELISRSPLIKTSGVSKDLQNQLGRLLWRWI